jgi:hypothetical protein
MNDSTYRFLGFCCSPKNTDNLKDVYAGEIVKGGGIPHETLNAADIRPCTRQRFRELVETLPEDEQGEWRGYLAFLNK